MAWIRSEDLNGQETLDEVVDGEAVYVQVENPEDAVVYLDEKINARGENHGLHPGIKF